MAAKEKPSSKQHSMIIVCACSVSERNNDNMEGSEKTEPIMKKVKIKKAAAS